MSEEKVTIEDEHPLYGRWQSFALTVKIRLQMFIGLLIILAILLKMIFLLFEFQPETYDIFVAIYDLNALEIVSYGLGISAALELAYMLFTPGPDEAIQPLILGIASTLLLIVAKIGPSPAEGGTAATWGLALIFAVLIVSMAGLLWIKRAWMDKRADTQTEAPQAAPVSIASVDPASDQGSSAGASSSHNRWGS